MSSVGRHRLASYVLFGLLALLTIVLRLGPAVLAGLFSYALLDLTCRALSRRMRMEAARWVSLAVFLVVAVLAIGFLARFLRQSASTVPAILAKSLPMLEEASIQYGVELPFENLEELRRTAIESITENAADVTHASGLLTKGVFNALLSIVTAVLAFMSATQALERGTLYSALRSEFDARVRRFLSSFERVLGAQVLVSAINAGVTAAFLLAFRFPHSPFLISATFVLGLLPLIGNILSNLLICLIALTVSARLAAFSLAFLLVVHKGQYFLNGQIVGARIRAPMWQTLAGILLGEALLGVPGIILAPAMLHYVRQELEAIPAGGA